MRFFNDRIMEKFGQETKKLSDSVKSVKQQAQQIQAVNGRVDGLVEIMNDRFVELDEHVSERIVELSDGMNERLAKVTESVDSRFKSVASENKQSRHELSKDIEVNTKEIINKELTSFKEVVAEINQNNMSKFNELSSRVINLQDKVSTISCLVML
jgi:DNA anti-recombination protein RmuC